MSLSKSDSQFLLAVTQRTIADMEEGIKRVREFNRELFEVCDPEDANTLEAFHALNENRNTIRKAKITIKRLAGISKQLKQELRR